MNVYDIGDVVRLSNAMTVTSTGSAVDPGALTLVIQDPTGLQTAYVYGTDAELVKDSTGNYHCDVTVSTAGKWRFRWTSTGSAVGSEESVFLVKARRVN